MPTKIFISASPQDDDQREWAKAFAQRIARAAGYRDDEVYLYLSQRVGTAIPEEIKENILQAKRMICLISDDYFQSSWCAWEHMLFWQKGKAFEECCVGVLQPFLRDWIELSESLRKSRLAFNLEVMKNKSRLPFTSDLRRHLKGSWTDWLVDTRHANFHTLGSWPDTLHDDISKSLYDLAAPTDPSDRLLEKFASLAVYSLAADRYHDGGWGFSLGSSFDFDEYDGDELEKGRYDLDAVILKVFAAFLPPHALTSEWYAVFGGARGERKPKIQVRDRLPLIAGLLACLSSDGRLGTEHEPIADMLRQLHNQLGENRWVIEERLHGGERSDYGAALLTCLTELEPAINTLTVPLQEKLRDEVTRELIEESREEAQGVVSKSIIKDNLFSAALARARRAQPGADGVSAAESMRKEMHSAILWLLLSMSPDCAGLLDTELGKNVAYAKTGWKQEYFDKLLQLFEENAALEEPDACVLTLTLACAAVLAAPGVDMPQRTQSMKRILVGLLQREDADKILFEMNAVGWVSLVLFSQRVAAKPLDSSSLMEMWDLGRALRAHRNRAVSSETAAQGIQEAIDAVVEEQVREAHGIWLPAEEHASEGAPAGTPFEEFLQRLRSASFWGPPMRRRNNGNVEKSGDFFLSGALRVRASTKQVELETPGYNAMFLHPFSELTGMNISNLRSVRREFGDRDEELVRLMGETVVMHCYERVRDSFMESTRSFEDRTKDITDQLTSPGWDPTNGFDDLLIVKKGKRGRRWVYRSAVIQPQLGPDRFEDRVVSWRFVEMPEAVHLLVKEGDRVKEFANDLRPSA